ncbi:hypothetical protein TNCV_3445661 [Trichonephila clavipes]|nr:hypothetical protein TNCV_3445661 [Trichonephila clavipes]
MSRQQVVKLCRSFEASKQEVSGKLQDNSSIAYGVKIRRHHDEGSSPSATEDSSCRGDGARMPNSPSQMVPDMIDWRQIWGSDRPMKGINNAETAL